MQQINVGINTKALTAQLQAISKHTTALANDLKSIEESVCAECGELREKEDLYVNNVMLDTIYRCRTKDCINTPPQNTLVK